MSPLRSRKGGHRHVSFGQWLGCVAFAAAVPSLIGILAVMLSYLFGIFEPSQKDNFLATLGNTSAFALVIMAFAIIPVLVFSLLGLPLLALGYGGWASPIAMGGFVTGLLGVIWMREPLWALVGASYGLAFWWGLALFAPSALTEQTP